MDSVEQLLDKSNYKGKGKGHPRTGNENPEGE
jgi:hypothetical protein